MSNKVLLVEDDPTVRLILTRRLKASGYDVVHAEDGVQALELLRRERICLVVSDWIMPEMDGLELCRRVKTDPELSPNYFIMMTARGDKSDCIQGLEAGADDYLSKPVDYGELIARLKVGQRVIAQHRSLQDLASTDSLTFLRNRRSFEEDLEGELMASKRYERPFSLLLIDLDDFKTINDTWGHGRGDDCLRLFARFLAWSLRRSDHVYRIGGDEFAVILPEAVEAEAEKTSLRLREMFPSFMEEQEEGPLCPLSFSIGTASFHPGSDLSASQIVRSADKNMYMDKKRPAKDVPDSPPPRKKETVMVVDDEPVTRMILEKGLAASGYHVLQAENGEECLDLLRDTRVDVLILDWILPGMDGVEVCKRLHSSERIKSPHIIMVTIMGGSRSKIYALDSGADDFINKPIDMDELLARVRVGMRVMNAREKIAKAEKLEGVLQMAGAVAHELSQPLTSLMGLVDLLLLQFQPSDPLHGRLCQIVNEAQRLGDLTKKIGRIVKYETRDYLGDTRIVDIDKASRRDP